MPKSKTKPTATTSTSSPNLTTTVYQTPHGLFSLTWSRTSLRRHSLHLTHLSHSLLITPFLFFNQTGHRTLSPTTHIFFDFSRAKFSSRPEPESGYYIAIVVDGVMAVVAGDMVEEAWGKSKAKGRKEQVVVLRREHVYGNKVYGTRVTVGGRDRDVEIDCRGGDDPRLYFSIDRKRVLQVKHLKWKFRGNERIEVDGVHIQVSWDVYNWLFDDEDQEGYALFMFRFEKQGLESGEYNGLSPSNFRNGLLFESHESCGLGFEKKKMKKKALRSARSASSSSLSSASSVCSSVMEWESVEENELKGPSDFSLLVYFWKR